MANKKIVSKPKISIIEILKTDTLFFQREAAKFYLASQGTHLPAYGKIYYQELAAIAARNAIACLEVLIGVSPLIINGSSPEDTVVQNTTVAAEG